MEKTKGLIQHPAFFYVACLGLTLIAYAESLTGTPIWDDLHYIFKHQTIITPHTHWHILKNFTWPISVFFQKFIYDLFGEYYPAYHLINLLLHLSNGFLIYQLAKYFNFRHGKWLVLLFLLHPSNVISVAWMVQFKTLLCMFFALLSAIFFIQGKLKTVFYPISWFMFLLAVLSKSAAIPLCGVFIIYSFLGDRFKSLKWAIPFLIISSFSVYKILNSHETRTAQIQFSDKSFVADTSKPQLGLPASPPQGDVTAKKDESPQPTAPPSFLRDETRWELCLKSSVFYFWQALLPVNNSPIKGQALKPHFMIGVIHLIFLLALYIIFRKGHIWLSLLYFYLMITPYLGLIVAPYMTITWVSDQHLYLALPFILFFLIWLIGKNEIWFKYAFPILGLFFLYSSYNNSLLFKNDLVFYQAALKTDERNLPIQYNLAVAHIRRREMEQALRVTGNIMIKSQEDESLRRNKYFIYVEELHREIVKDLSQ